MRGKEIKPLSYYYSSEISIYPTRALEGRAASIYIPALLTARGKFTVQHVTVSY